MRHSPELLAAARRTYCGGDHPYFLYVGKLTARRNVPRIITALGDLKKLHPGPHKLVVVGLNTTGIDLAAMARAAGVEEDVKHYPYVADEDLAPLYSGAEAFVLPYSYESAAALTLLEAQAAGTPVITADTVGLRQAAGSAALLTPDVETPTITAAMLRIVMEPGLRADLIERGLANAARYSWLSTSSQVLDILRESAS